VKNFPLFSYSGFVKKLIIVSFIFFISTSYLHSQEIRYRNFSGFYASPGVDFSWNFHGNFIIGPKISFGLLKEGKFYNITFGFLTSKDSILYPYYYLEGQVGASSESTKLLILSGLGLGIDFHPNDIDNKISYKMSLFTGDIVFLNASILYNKKFYPDVGFETVLPFPVVGLK
jgi:hypothetical protein